MIVVRLKGGLGNQMFQYAAGRRLAHKLSVPLRIDASWFDLAKDVDAPRTYDLGCFDLEAHFIKRSAFVLPDLTPSLKPKVYKYTKGLLKPRLHPYVKLDEDSVFDKSVLSLPDNTYLDGFWQSEKYFKDAAAVIRQDLTFKSNARPATKEIKKLMQAKVPTVSVHVRRGDYVSTKSAQETLGALPIDYYAKSTGYMLKKLSDPTFIVFSDDLDWCKNNLKFESGTIYAESGGQPWEDMYLMGLCDHHIIANSSFSWWGAWLNPSSKKIVIGPKRWFANTKMDASSILPAGWVQL